jgi:hypothetical protein
VKIGSCGYGYEMVVVFEDGDVGFRGGDVVFRGAGVVM